MKRWTNDRIGAGLLLLFFMAYGLLSQEIRLLPGQSGNVFNARTLPHFLTAVGVIGALWLFFRSQLPSSGGLRTLNWGRFAGTLILMWCYGLALRPAGFLIATAAFLGASFLLLGERRFLLFLQDPTKIDMRIRVIGIELQRAAISGRGVIRTHGFKINP